MDRYTVSQFDKDTFIVVDQIENREMCVCGSYEQGMDAEARAWKIVAALNCRGNGKSVILPADEH